VAPANRSLCHIKIEPTILECSSPSQKLATYPSAASACRFELKAPRWRSEMELLRPLFLHPRRKKRETSQSSQIGNPLFPANLLICFFLLHLLLHRYMKHNSNSQKVSQFTMDVLIIVHSPMVKMEEADWFCENRDCRWSVTLSLSPRAEASPRCVCGWPLRRADAPAASTYLEFLHNDEKLGKQPHARKE